jgi:hypothetical protein
MNVIEREKFPEELHLEEGSVMESRVTKFRDNRADVFFVNL